MDQQQTPDPITQAALRSLHDIATPPPVAWWPQTWGWAAIALLFVFVLTLWVLMFIRRYRRNAYRREAIRLINEIEPKILEPTTRTEAVLELAAILKRTALAAWPKQEVASLSGSAWVQFLDEHDDDGAGHALERLLDDVEYRPPGLDRLPSNVCGDLIASARKWIERHHVSA